MHLETINIPAHHAQLHEALSPSTQSTDIRPYLQRLLNISPPQAKQRAALPNASVLGSSTLKVGGVTPSTIKATAASR